MVKESDGLHNLNFFSWIIAFVDVCVCESPFLVMCTYGNSGFYLTCISTLSVVSDDLLGLTSMQLPHYAKSHPLKYVSPPSSLQLEDEKKKTGKEEGRKA